MNRTAPADVPTAPEAQDARTHDARAYDARRILGWLWRGYLRQHMGALVLASAFMVAEGATLGALSWMIEPMFDRIFVAGQTSAIAWVGGAILGLFGLRAVSSVIQRVLMTRVAQTSVTAMQSDLVAHLMRLGGAFHLAMPPGALMERVQGDTLAVLTVWSTLIQGAARDAVALVSLMVVAAAIDPVWTLVALVGVPLLVLPTMVLQRYVRRKTAALRETAARRSVRLSEIFHGIAPITLNGMEAYQHRRFRRLVDGIVRAEVRMSAGRAALPALIDVTTGLGFLAVLVVGGREVASGEKSLGEFMAFFTAMALAFQPLRKLGATAGLWQTAAASLERLMRLFDARPAITAPARPLPVPRRAPEIRFEGVSLAYGEAPGAAGRVVHGRGRAHDRARGAVRRGQEHLAEPRRAADGPRRGPDHLGRRADHGFRPGGAARRGVGRGAGLDALRRDHPRERHARPRRPAGRAAPRRGDGARGGVRGRPCRGGSTRRRACGAPRSRAGNGSAWR